ncbi:MAG: hypothetical protein VX737_00100 [Pseudomonadota bacterium]|nr:hypothetical protein [Pseudomonadota bacterium]
MRSSKDSVHWGWYSAAFLSSFIMGMSAFVISFNFMIGKVPLLFVFVCAASGMLLNMTLYWMDSAQKLAGFYHDIRKNPRLLLTTESLTSIISALCVGFLALKSYLDQFSSLQSSTLAFLPFMSIAVAFSLANIISTFVLYYSPEDSDVSAQKMGTDKKSKDQDVKQYLSKQSSALFNSIKNTPLSKHLSNSIAISQSALYAFTNYICIFQILTLVIPSMTLTAIMIGALFSVPLFFSECKFNIPKMQKLPNLIQRRQWTRHRKIQASLFSLVLANSFANGWISLGGLIGLSPAITYLIVAIGSIVSLSVMLSNLDDINNLIFRFADNRYRIIPENTEDTYKMVNGVLQLLFVSSGLFLILNPVAFHASFALSPIATSLVLCGFCCSVIPDAVYNLGQQYQLKFSKPTTQEDKPTLNKKNDDTGSVVSNIGIFGQAAKAACALGVRTVSATEQLFFSRRVGK